jgi:hypothetical protein
MSPRPAETSLHLILLHIRCARRTEVGLWASSPEVSDNDLTMETASDDDLVSFPVPFHAGLTMEQAQVHFNAAMVKEQLEPQPVSRHDRRSRNRCLRGELAKIGKDWC